MEIIRTDHIHMPTPSMEIHRIILQERLLGLESILKEIQKCDHENVDDIAYAIMRISGNICPNCKVKETPQWRKGKYNDIIGNYENLCNACGLKYDKGKYCIFCTHIYGVKELNEGGYYKCLTCDKWDHKECVAKYGGGPVNIIKGEHQYFCNRCVV